ncbi:putative uncharacterized protein [Ruminococcus sp. CAG:353]|nr:putative uncharacterized protein [Ruminococcus sp. CAG:353]
MKYRSKSRFTALLTAIAMIASNFTASSPVSRYVLNEINVSAADGAEGETTTAPQETTVTTVTGEADVPDDTEQTDSSSEAAVTEVSQDDSTNTADDTDGTSVPSDDTTVPDGTEDDAAEDDGDNTDDTPVSDNVITINTSEQFVEYSKNYEADPAKYQNIDVSIAITSGNLDNLVGFVSIGTAQYPFAANIKVTSDSEFKLTLDQPLFAYIYDSANINTDVIISRSLPVSGDVSDSALFAEHVIHDTEKNTTAQWSVSLMNAEAAFSSVIGTLGENVNAKLTITNNADSVSVSGSGSAGLACGRMEKNSSLTVITSGSASYNVSSSSGNAGGMIGTMADGSAFTLNNEFALTGEVTAAGYAGGLVGYAENASVSFEGTAMVSGTVSGALATGGVFGYYKSSEAENSFDISRYAVSCTLNRENSGGLFGKLENSGNMTINKSDTEAADISVNRTSSDKQTFGGLIGTYLSDNTSNSLTVSGISVSADNSAGGAEYFGGLIGKADDDSYIRLENVSVSASGCKNVTSFGGIAGYADKAFIDAENVTVNTNGDFIGGGIIGNMNGGVLRLGGTTDLTGTKAAGGGQIIGTRGAALIYAQNGWQLNRGEAASFDDIGTWGEVLRLSSSLREDNIFNINETEHTVTVKRAGTTVGSLAEFAVLALNMQLNSGISSDSTLLFESTSTTGTSLLSSDITLNCNIDLSGTGITGLTRDDGENDAYTGTFNGSGHTITLAVGEPYGYRSNTALAAGDASDGNGRIYRHYYSGLFAKTENITFNNLIVDGIINVKYTDNARYYIGGLSALHSGNITVQDLTVQENINVSGNTGNYCFVGGIAGQAAENSSPAIVISGSTISPEINCSGNANFICGGAFAEIGQNDKFSVTADNVKLGAAVTNSSTAGSKKVGGFIGNISSNNGAASDRTISLTNITIDSENVTSAYGGALLGESWNNCEVSVGSETEKGITVKSAEVTQNGNGDFAGFVTNATGCWKVYDVNIEGITVSGVSAASFGMLVNKGVYKYDSITTALYLETESENAYKIGSAVISIGLNTIYDEIIATCSGSFDDEDAVLWNDTCAVVSIHTSGGAVTMDGAGCNTYQNQTSVKKANPYSRYYYDLDVIRGKNVSERTDVEKLMLWSVNLYAYSNIKQYFNDAFNKTSIPAGNYDMTGYSYYPVDMPSGMNIADGAVFTFCNDKIVNSEKPAVGERSQHYLMHCGLFRNSDGNITAGNITFSGTVGADTDYSGAMFCGTVMGSVNSTAKAVLNGIVFDGIRVNSTESTAPLLINKIDSYTALELSNVSTTEKYRTESISSAASSLIGDVGSSDGNSKDIKLTFSGLTLDGRKAAVSDTAVNAALSKAYNTDMSIFSKAILLNSFRFKAGSNCSGTYNFRRDEDWDEDAAKHNVAYGMEISGSKEYKGMQKMYFKSDSYTNPTGENAEYDFSGFLPYVAVSYSENNNYHEIKVNQTALAELDTGCGTYNDPYIISQGKQLELLDKILSNNLGDSEDGAVVNYQENSYSAWCNEKKSHKVLLWDAESSCFRSEDGTTSIKLADMQKTLASAYYMLGNDVTITSADFVGIGKNVPFKGALFGNGHAITNETVQPLIYQSTGAVIKDITVNVTANFKGKFSAAADSKYETDGNGTTAFYGGVIGIVNGGDNIIDNVSVEFTNAGTIDIKSGTDYGNKAVGGYIGVIRYGAVIFRNMDNASHLGITAGMNNIFGSNALLYCNPIIGRVIDGFAVTETSAFNGAEDRVTMKNGTKNYSIADISTAADKISFESNDTNSGTIKISDSQQLFILGCISMSGAGSADSSGYSKFSYGENKMVRHALYSDIGTDDSEGNTSDHAVAKTDAYVKNTVPYIIYKYTNAISGSYPARNLTNHNFAFDIDLAKNTYELPDGFRGIGSLNSSDADMAMHINSLNGNGSTVKLNMSFYRYGKDYDRYYNDININNTTSVDCKTGLGLFNNLIQSSDNENNTISNLIISGHVDYEYYKDHSGKKNIIYENNSSFSCVGALAGVGSNLRLDKIQLEKLSVNSCFVSGGIVGFAKKLVQIKDLKSDDLNVSANFFSGGIIGIAGNCNVKIDGSSDSEGLIRGSITSGSISLVGDTSRGEGASLYGVGIGAATVIGAFLNTNNTALTSLSVTNINIEDLDISAPLIGRAMLGGIVGCCGNTTAKNIQSRIQNVDIKNVDINKEVKRFAFNGGIIGLVKEGVKKCEISNVKIIGDKNNKNTITGYRHSGGIIGLTSSDTIIDNCLIENYEIVTDEYGEDVGGIVGKINDNKSTLIVKNSKISDCVIKINDNNSKNSDGTYSGGIVGKMAKNSCLYGYNISLDNVHFKNNENKKAGAGEICGYMQNNTKVKVVGISARKGESGIPANIISKKDNINTAPSLCIYADYNGSCLDEPAANKEASTISSDSNVDDMGAYPYVTVNPKNVIDKTADSPKFLTGDGADKSAVEAIIADISKGTGYINAADEYNDVFQKYEGKLATFNEKTGASVPDDFSVLLINESNYRKITEMLNSFIHILTNDTSISSYAQTGSSVFSVDIMPMRLNETSGAFESGENFTKTLEYKNGYFRMTNMDYDSNYKQFTLIDIQYLDPADTSKTAYHLYIPVYVEKMLNFDFRAAALSGTTYNVSAYTDGNPVLENYGTPITAHVTYSYKRTAEEWQNVINGGEDLLTAYGKYVLLESKQDLPDDTSLVLVDRNNGSKAYYSTIGEAFTASDDKLDFSKFSTSDDKVFEPVTFCDLLKKAADITASQADDGTLVKCSNDISKATFKIGDDYYRKKTESDADASLLYSVTLTAKEGMTDADGILILDEDYYISFFTKADNSEPMRNITMKCGSRLGDTDMTPSRLDNESVSESMVHMILGNLYDQTFTFRTTGDQVINDSNRVLKAELTATISLKSESAENVKSYLNYDSIKLYHGFVIEATRTDESGTEKGIKGNPSVSGTYKIGSTEYAKNFSNTDSVIMVSGGTEEAPLDIKARLISGSVTITCDDMVITYPDGESIIAQFPERKDRDDTYGVTLSASSNLAYVSDNIEQSKMSESRSDSNGKSYYRENIEAATLSYNLPSNSPNEMIRLGINGLDTNDKITAVGYYNVLNLPETAIDKAKKVSFTLSLYQKTDSGIYDAVPIAEYLENITLYDKNGTAKAPVSSGDSYEYVFDRETELNYEAGSFEVVSSYSVITGGVFESKGKTYSNYKVQLTAQLLDENGEPIENSGCSDYIIYTNAKINSQLISVG